MSGDRRVALQSRDISFGTSRRLDPELVWSVATQLNRAHRHLGTELMDATDDRVEIRVRWRPDLADGFDERFWSALVLASIADHICSLAALVALDDPARFAATLSVRIEHRRAARARHDLHGVVDLADCTQSGLVLRTSGMLTQPSLDPGDVAAIHGSVMVNPLHPDAYVGVR